MPEASTRIAEVCRFLEEFAPTFLAEDWDNVGLLVGNSESPVNRLMVCLTVTPTSVQEAIHRQAQLIVTHHPFPFRAMKQITAATTPGRLLLDLIGAGIGVYSSHTAFDSARFGINQQLAVGLGLREIIPLIPKLGTTERDNDLGSGRQGQYPSELPLSVVVGRLKCFLAIDGLHQVGSSETPIQRVAVACGSAGVFLEPARRANCSLLVTGETNFHTCLEAEANQTAMLLTGHFASERFAVEQLSKQLDEQFVDVTVWACEREQDPLTWV